MVMYMVVKYQTEHLTCCKIGESYQIYEKLGSKLLAVYYNQNNMKLAPDFPVPENTYQYFDEMCEIITTLYELGE